MHSCTFQDHRSAFILVLLDKQSQEEDHARLGDDAKLQLKQPNLG